MKSNRKKIINIVFVTLLLVITLCVHFRAKHIGSLPRQYTIGIITDIYSSRSSSKTVEYNYLVKGTKYVNTIVDNRNYREVLKKGECFVVSIPIEFESKGLLLKDHPTNGYCELGEIWEEIPARFKMMKVEEY